MSPSPPDNQVHDERDSICQQIDAQIARLEAEILRLRSLRNTYAPIRRLHPEILQEIFFLAHITSERKGRMTLVTSWICNDWRQLAHDTSALWAHIDFNHPEWVEAAASRTRRRNLEFNLERGICLCTAKEPRPNLGPICLRNLPRINKLKILDSRLASYFGSHLREWRLPAPFLVELHLRGLSIPQDIFSGNFPALRSLSLSSCYVNWNAGKLPIHAGLTELIVKDPSPRATVDNIVKVLQVLGPTLEMLHFTNVFVDPFEVPVDVFLGKIRFQKLNLFKVSQEWPEMIAFLLDRIILPRSLTMELLISEWAESNLIQALVSARHMETWPVVLLEVRDFHDNLMDLRLVEDGVNDDTGTDKFVQNPRNIDLHITLETLSQGLTAFNLLPIQPPEKVYFISDPELAVFDHISNLGTVKDLRLDLRALGEFMNFIDERVATLQQATETFNPRDSDLAISLGRSVIAFPNLKRLHISGTSYEPTLEDSEDLESLKKWLGWKKVLGDQLESLILSRVTVVSLFEIAAAFHDIVGDFRMIDITEGEHRE